MKYFGIVSLFVKRVIVFVFTLIIIYFVYDLLVPNNWHRASTLYSVVLLWLFSAYFVLPFVVRILSKIFVPRYFFGRTITADGLLADPVNLAVNGTKKQLVQALQKAGWQEADPLTLHSTWKMVYCGVLRRSYPRAPVSNLFLFGERQALAFQQDVDNNPRKRHHVRFWRTPRRWYLPGGHRVDWLGAATYDDAVGMSYFTLQITHRIDADIDKERDYLIGTLKATGKHVRTRHIKHFFPPYKTRNGGGDHIITDGSLTIVDL